MIRHGIDALFGDFDFMNQLLRNLFEICKISLGAILIQHGYFGDFPDDFGGEKTFGLREIDVINAIVRFMPEAVEPFDFIVMAVLQ